MTIQRYCSLIFPFVDTIIFTYLSFHGLTFSVIIAHIVITIHYVLIVFINGEESRIVIINGCLSISNILTIHDILSIERYDKMRLLSSIAVMCIQTSSVFRAINDLNEINLSNGINHHNPSQIYSIIQSKVEKDIVVTRESLADLYRKRGIVSFFGRELCSEISSRGASLSILKRI